MIGMKKNKQNELIDIFLRLFVLIICFDRKLTDHLTKVKGLFLSLSLSCFSIVSLTTVESNKEHNVNVWIVSIWCIVEFVCYSFFHILNDDFLVKNIKELNWLPNRSSTLLCCFTNYYILFTNWERPMNCKKLNCLYIFFCTRWFRIEFMR